MTADRPIYVIRLQPVAAGDQVHDLRAVLKVLLRRYGFRCLEVHEEPASTRKEHDDDDEIKRLSCGYPLRIGGNAGA